MTDLLNIHHDHLHAMRHDLLAAEEAPPKFLLLYGSLRELSYSRAAAEESARILEALGAECFLFDPRGLPQVGEDEDHPKVVELRQATPN